MRWTRRLAEERARGPRVYPNLEEPYALLGAAGALVTGGDELARTPIWTGMSVLVCAIIFFGAGRLIGRAPPSNWTGRSIGRFRRGRSRQGDPDCHFGFNSPTGRCVPIHLSRRRRWTSNSSILNSPTTTTLSGSRIRSGGLSA